MDVGAIIRNDDFSVSCENFVHMVQPLLFAFWEIDNSTPATPIACYTIQKLKKHVFALQNPSFSLLPKQAIWMDAQSMKRWKMIMSTDLHYAKVFLNPFLQGQVDFHNNGAQIAALNWVIVKLGGILDVDRVQAIRDFTKYMERIGDFHLDLVQDPKDVNVLPHQW